MGDVAIIWMSLKNPDEAELVEILANIPSDWRAYMQALAEREGKEGRYVPCKLLYEFDTYRPPESRERHEANERATFGASES